jgi:O-methyltransferase involved in polyketide biosynthesis
VKESAAVPEPLIRDISDTALWVAAYRADETDRPNPLFRDPCARALAGARGAAIVANVKHPAVRYSVVLRTAVLDELITAAVGEGRFGP